MEENRATDVLVVTIPSLLASENQQQEVESAPECSSCPLAQWRLRRDLLSPILLLRKSPVVANRTACKATIVKPHIYNYGKWNPWFKEPMVVELCKNMRTQNSAAKFSYRLWREASYLHSMPGLPSTPGASQTRISLQTWNPQGFESREASGQHPCCRSLSSVCRDCRRILARPDGTPCPHAR